ncbi:HD domain-containing protein [Cupriavidus pauculus]|uniref:N-methyl-D-aspartate receptor NMDAR2C subunit n=1 Tax=Cupriavidus pauculus TaxID=82633 RepID=A0A2N5CE65_9BURK|nr:hypothetical protein [Cupriavidus pauculus]PLQ00462.1 hypothetical protein CYJ10_12675 [Cupriavidus pauculus]
MAPQTANALRTRFLALWSRAGGRQAEAVYAALADRYAEPDRHYHTLQHVRRCLRDLDWARSAIADRDAEAVELALWCHDVVYTAGASDNEARSAEWLRQWSSAGAEAQTNGKQGGANGMTEIERVARLILDTSHTHTPSDTAGCFVVDIDLAVLGYPRRWFCGDAVHLRAERPDLDAMSYDRGERAFLGTLLTRPRIFLTEPFHTRYEARARRNLAWRLDQPSPPGLSSPLRGTLP